MRLVPLAAFKEPEHLARQPFGQIPTYEEGDPVLFESGSIVLHIADAHPGLLPGDPDARARAITWMLMERDKPWFEDHKPIVEARVRDRLARLSARLSAADWLDGDFTAGDLMMVEVLMRPASASVLPDYPNLAAYVALAEDRAAFTRAFQAQLAVFKAASGD